MKNKALCLTVLVLGVAIVSGVFAGRYFPQFFLSSVQAKPDTSTQPLPPEWSELNVVYWTSDLNSKTIPQNNISTIGAQTLSNFDQVENFSKDKGLDVLVFDPSVVSRMDPTWAKQQAKLGTAFVGINVSGSALGLLTGDTEFNTNENWSSVTWAEPFVAYTVYRVSGDPKEISLLEEKGALFPENLEMQQELGIKTVAVSGIRSYGPLDGNLQSSLEDLRLFLAGRDRVGPSPITK